MDEESLDLADGAEAEALELLRGFGEHGLVDVVGTNPRSMRHLVVREVRGESQVFVSDDLGGYGQPFRLSEADRGYLSTLFNGNPAHPEAEALYLDFLRTRPHSAIGRDIFVTFAHGLLEHRHHSHLRDANIRRPSEALRVAGLLLRSRGDFTYFARGIVMARTGRREFYRALAQVRLADYWGLHFYRTDNTGDPLKWEKHNNLSWSVISRVARAYEARDQIGAIYHGSRAGQPDEIDLSQYHFTYLLQLLSGAVDAFIRIAHVHIAPTSAGPPSLRRVKYLTGLERAGASGLVSEVRSPGTQAVLALLSTLRNLIHEVELQTTVTPTGRPGARIPYDVGIQLWLAASQVGSPENFGLIRRTWDKMIRNGIEDVEAEHFEITIDLYVYACALIDAVSGILDRMSRHLVPPGYGSAPNPWRATRLIELGWHVGSLG